MSPSSNAVPERSYAHTSSRNILKQYDNSPVQSTLTSPSRSPALSRNNSSTSINSTASAPVRHSERRQSEPAQLDRGDLSRKSNTSESSSQAHAVPKRSGFKGIFAKKTDEEKKKEKMKRTWEREKERLEYQKWMLESKHTSAAKANKITQSKGQDVVRKHPKPNVKTAGITDFTKSVNVSAAEQEARYPHSGPPVIRVEDQPDNPELSRIESQDQPDEEVDQWQKSRREWNDSHEDNLDEILEIRSRPGSRINSPWASPAVSREPSPSRYATARPSMGSKRNSYQGAYQRDSVTGRWTKKTTPPTRLSSGHITPIYPNNEGVDPNVLAKSLMERLHTSG